MYTYVGTRDFIKYHIKSLRQALEVAVNDDYLEVVQLGLKEGEELGELMASGIYELNGQSDWTEYNPKTQETIILHCCPLNSFV